MLFPAANHCDHLFHFASGPAALLADSRYLQNTNYCQFHLYLYISDLHIIYDRGVSGLVSDLLVKM